MRFTIGHLFSGIGGSALGAAAASARFGDAEATFHNLGGVDVDAQACEDFERLTGAPALCADMHDLQPPAARAVAEQLLLSLLVSHLGAFQLSPHDVWVQPDQEVA